MKGIILAGGIGSRLKDCTKVTNKHLLPIYDKPMIYYPINTLVGSGIKEIMIITGYEHAGAFINLLGDGSEFGANFSYRVQKQAGGIADALRLCEQFAGDEVVAVILGDNIYGGKYNTMFSDFEKQSKKQDKIAKVFLKPISGPERFGVATIKRGRVDFIEEKPKRPKSNLAVTGLYLYDKTVWDVIKTLKPSKRGELEVTDINNWFINNGTLEYTLVKGFWSDAGTPNSLLVSSKYAQKMANTLKKG